MLSADADLEIRPGLASEFDCALDHLTHAILVEYSEWISLEDFQILILFRELRIVVAREAHRGLGEIVRTEGEELGFPCHFVRSQCRTRNLDHGADVVLELLHAGL